MWNPDLTTDIIGAAIRVHRKLGPGLLESAYEECLAYELETLGKRVERQKAVPLVYESVKLDCGFRADLVIEGQVIVELKCKEALHPVDEAQLLSHLRLLTSPSVSRSTFTSFFFATEFEEWLIITLSLRISAIK